METILRTIILSTCLLFTSKLIAQDITMDNYRERMDSLKKFIGEEKYGEATDISYALLNFFDRSDELPQDSLYVLKSKTYYNLTNIYLFEDFELSVKYADSSIQNALKTDNPRLKQRAYSIKYYCLYDVKGEEQTLDFLADECIRYAELANDPKMMGESYMHKCNSLVELGSSNEAQIFCDKAVELFKTIGDQDYLSSVYNNIGNVFVKSNELEKALDYYNKSHEISLQINDARDISTSARNIAEKNEWLQNYKTAAEFYRVFGDSIESYYTGLLDSKFAEADAKYQAEQKDKEIAQQQLTIAKQRNTRNIYIFGSIALLLIGLGVFQWRSNKQRQKKIALEAQLQKEQEVNDLRSKFLGNIAHEIRTPLTLVSGNLGLALDQMSEDDGARSNVEIALENSKKITADTNEILELLKFEKSKITIETVPVALNETLKRIVLAFLSLADMNQIDLHYESEIDPLVMVNLDPEKTEKIINNLVSNALKYSPAKSAVNVQSRLDEGVLEISVKDRGQGIHYDETEKIFERFYQSDRNPSVGGVGIGLSLSRELAEAMGGTLKVESILGEGSTFYLSLPVTVLEVVAVSEDTSTAAPRSRTDEESATVELSPERQMANILIVEDNPEMANYLSEILTPHYHCTIAYDGEQALAKIQAMEFDLVTSDIMMPRMDGFQLREALNKVQNFKNIPFILISAKTLEDDKIRGFKLGIDDYIVKPFNKNELLARVDNLLLNKRAREAWRLQNDDLLSDTESSDQKLLKKIEAIVMENMDNEEFKIKELASSVGYSQRQLTRILKQYTGLTPVQFILEVRLQKAYHCLQHNLFFTLAEVRYHVGISSSAYFNKKFRERFGISPSELLA